MTNEDSDVMICPNCGVEGPKTLYCLNCGYPQYQAMMAESEKSEEVSGEVKEATTPIESYGPGKLNNEVPYVEEQETIDSVETEVFDESIEMVEDESSVPSVVLEEPSIKTSSFEKPPVSTVILETIPETERTDEKTLIDPILSGVMRGLAKSISLKLWLINMLHEGNIKENHFNRLFENYEARMNQCLNRRNEMFTRTRNLDEVERELNEAKVGLAELEMKKIIGDISNEEYEVKAPAYQWDIRKFEKEISKRKVDITFLEDLTQVISDEEMEKMINMAENLTRELDNFEDTGKISFSTVSKVRQSLEEILSIIRENKMRV